MHLAICVSLKSMALRNILTILYISASPCFRAAGYNWSIREAPGRRLASRCRTASSAPLEINDMNNDTG